MTTSHEAATGGIFDRLADFVIRWPLVAIGLWIAVAAGLTLAIPPLAVVAAHKQVEALPADAPVVAGSKQMSEAFHETQHGSLLLVVLTDEKGLGPADEDVYRTLVGKLHKDTADVMSTQDFLGTDALREVLQSKDNKTWALPITLVGDPGTPEAGVSYKHVGDMVRQTVAKSTLTANLTGPAATAADLMDIAAKDMHVIETGTTVMVLLILIIVYRNPITMLIPLVTIGVSLATAQGTLAGLGELGLGLTGETVVFVTAVMFGAGTDYAVFLISRYHDYVRQGVSSDEAVRKALMSIGKVIAASAATVAVTFLAMIFSQLQIFATVGPAISISVTLAFLAAVTFLPAVMVLTGRRGWIKPRSDLTHRFWRRSAIRIVRRPKTHLVASLIVLATLASCMTFVRYNYDDRKTLPTNVESAAGFAALDRHLPVNTLLPQYLFIQSPRDLRTPEALADLEQMARRVSQVPGITMVRGITRPMGESLEQTKATWQAGVVGGKLDDASKQIIGHTDDLNLLTHGSDQLAGALGEVRAQVAQSMGTVHGLLASLTAIEQQVGGQKLLRDVDNASKLITSMRAFGGSLDDVVAAGRGADTLLTVLDNNPICSVDPQCAEAREQLRRLADANDDGTLNNLSNLARELKSTQDTETLQAAVHGLSGAVSSALNALRSLGAEDPGGLQARLATLESGADQLADGSRKIADGVQQLVDQVFQMGSGLGEASAFLLGMKRGAARPSMSGFYIPPNALANNADFKTAAEFFMSPDGHATRYYVMSALNPFSVAAMDQVGEITKAARSAQPNTSLSDAKVSMLGMTEGLQDTRDYYNQDTEFIVVATILIVFLILVLLLRAIVAPLYLIASVLISYASALGIGVIVFQFLLGQELHWSAPGLTFILLVAVGADYNLLLISRIRDESPHGVRSGVIRTVSSTGAVITSAGLIFAASMFGLTVASISTLVQIGFVIGAGILLDTFLVRTITVPAVATLLGQANWWPSRLAPRLPTGWRSKWRKTSRLPASQRGGSLSDLVIPDDEDIFTHSLPLFGPGGVPLRLATSGPVKAKGQMIQADDELTTEPDNETPEAPDGAAAERPAEAAAEPAAEEPAPLSGLRELVSTSESDAAWAHRLTFALAVHGTRGDVEPCAAVGLELMRRGHEVRMAVPPNLITFVESAGLTAVPYGPDSQQTLDEDFFRKFWKIQNPINLVRIGAEYITRGWADMSTTLASLAAGADLVVTGMIYQEVAANVAEYHDIPLATLHYFPIRPNGHVIPIVPAPLIRSSVSAIWWLHRGMIKQAEDAQRRELGLPKAVGPAWKRMAARGALEIQAYDALCFPGLAAEWDGQRPFRPFVGSLTMESPTAADDEVLSWIAAGTPPVYFGFGSMPVESFPDTVRMIATVCGHLGQRALICSGNNDLDDVASYDHVKVVPAVSHAAIFPVCRAVVHHGGAGTTAAALRAGVPMLILWIGAEQPIWAAQIRRLEVGLARRFSATTRRSLVRDLRKILRPRYGKQARETATTMTKAAASVTAAADLVEQLARAATTDSNRTFQPSR